MNYKKWLSLQVEHDYFTDLKCPPPGFTTGKTCDGIIRRNGLRFFGMPDGYLFLYDPDFPEQPGQDNKRANLYLDVALSVPDPMFVNYSNLDIDFRRGLVYYIGNHGSGESAGLTLNQLNENQSVKSWQGAPVWLKPEQFVFTVTDAKPGEIIRLLDRDGNEANQWTIKEKKQSVSFLADTKGDAGLYLLEKNGKITSRFYADDRYYAARPAVIIGLQAVLPEGEEQAGPHFFNLRIAAREASWKYHVKSRNNSKQYKNLQVRTANSKRLSGVTFAREQDSGTGEETVFVSNAPLPIRQQPYTAIELVDEDGGATPLIPHLPNAGVSTLHYIQGKWESWIYVYI